eukprot:scaffold1004_cov105-Cylindrotheca_fusiformis.AAC.12
MDLSQEWREDSTREIIILVAQPTFCHCFFRSFFLIADFVFWWTPSSITTKRSSRWRWSSPFPFSSCCVRLSVNDRLFPCGNPISSRICSALCSAAVNLVLWSSRIVQRSVRLLLTTSARGENSDSVPLRKFWRIAVGSEKLENTYIAVAFYAVRVCKRLSFSNDVFTEGPKREAFLIERVLNRYRLPAEEVYTMSPSLLRHSLRGRHPKAAAVARRWIASSSSSVSVDDGASSSIVHKATAAAVALAAMGGYLSINSESAPSACEQQFPQQRDGSTTILGNSMSSIASDQQSGSSIEVRTTQGGRRLPVFTAQQVAQNNGQNGTPIWMSYGGNVYDVTNFVHNHPGGSEKILQAAGSSIEPFWHVYRQHFASDLPMRLMEKMIIGELHEEDQEKVDHKMEVLAETAVDPYALEPTDRHEALMVHSEQPMNAEVPEQLLTKEYLTPSNLFYIRHHHPVPYLTVEEAQNFELEIDLGSKYGTKKVSLEDIKKLPKVKVTATLQCSGNRRGGYNDFARTSGTSWGQGAISNAEWGGVRLRDLIKHLGLKEDDIDAQEEVQHVRFHAMDGMMASIGIEKAMTPYGDVIVAYEMNGKQLPRDHGYPLRVIVPGYAAVRNVKWVQKIELSKEEAEGPWQRGLNYKVLPPGVTDANTVDLKKVPSMTELSVQSGITSVVPEQSVTAAKPGETILVKASGWAYSGGGRNIVRVDVTGDGAQTWKAATLQSGSDQREGRAWAWTFWECEVPALVQADGSVQVYSKGVDLAFNSQPDSAKHNWNVRGLTNNSWYSKKVSVMQD